jgi:hypothetical protein
VSSSERTGQAETESSFSLDPLRGLDGLDQLKLGWFPFRSYCAWTPLSSATLHSPIPPLTIAAGAVEAPGRVRSSFFLKTSRREISWTLAVSFRHVVLSPARCGRGCASEELDRVTPTRARLGGMRQGMVRRCLGSRRSARFGGSCWPGASGYIHGVRDGRKSRRRRGSAAAGPQRRRDSARMAAATGGVAAVRREPCCAGPTCRHELEVGRRRINL